MKPLLFLVPALAAGARIGPRPPLYDPVAAAQLGRRMPTPVDPVSMEEVLMTAVPWSLRQIAATNLEEASKIIWSEFLDGSRPAWFTAMPTDVQSELISIFGPASTPAFTTASPTSPASSAGASASAAAITSNPTASGSTSSAAGTTSSGATAGTTSPTSATTTHPTLGAVASVDPSATSQSQGLSTGQKVGIGLGVPIAAVAIASALLACCLIFRRRSRRREGKAYDSDESRPPTAQFLPAAVALRPNSSIRGSATSDLLIPGSGVHEDPFIADEPPPPAVVGGGVRHQSARDSRGSWRSYGSLTMVPEEHEHEPDNEQDHRAMLPSQAPRRGSRGSAADLGYNGNPKWAAAAVPAQERADDGYDAPSSSNRASVPRQYSDHSADSWQNQHPALRDSRDSAASASTPLTPFTPASAGSANAIRIPRKPVGGSTVPSGLGTWSQGNAHNAADAPADYRTATQLSPGGRVNWPFSSTSNNSNNYWSSHPTDYDRYLAVNDEPYHGNCR